jgi:hypothetical protein
MSKSKIYGNKETVNAILDKLKHNTPFTYIRYGDGDFISMYPHTKSRVIGAANRSLITKEIRNKIIESYIIDEPNYLVGTLDTIEHPRSQYHNVDFKTIDRVVKKHPSTLYSAIAIQEAFMEDWEKFAEICKHLRKNKILYVNHYYEPVLTKFFGEITHFIKVPQYSATEKYTETLDKIMNTDTSTYDIIILSCGQLARVLAKDLFTSLPSKTILDFGSTSDKLIIGTPSFSKLRLRSHISKNMELIKNNVNNIISLLEEE